MMVEQNLVLLLLLMEVVVADQGVLDLLVGVRRDLLNHSLISLALD